MDLTEFANGPFVGLFLIQTEQRNVQNSYNTNPLSGHQKINPSQKFNLDIIGRLAVTFFPILFLCTNSIRVFTNRV